MADATLEDRLCAAYTRASDLRRCGDDAGEKYWTEQAANLCALLDRQLAAERASEWDVCKGSPEHG